MEVKKRCPMSFNSDDGGVMTCNEDVCAWYNEPLSECIMQTITLSLFKLSEKHGG